MPFFGDGREERMDAFQLECRLRGNPNIAQRKADYERRVAECRSEARAMGKQAIIDKLIASNPAYIRDLLETEDERFGKGSLVERYARTFFARAAQGTSGFAQDAQRLDPQPAGPVVEDHAPEHQSDTPS